LTKILSKNKNEAGVKKTNAPVPEKQKIVLALNELISVLHHVPLSFYNSARGIAHSAVSVVDQGWKRTDGRLHQQTPL